MNARTSSRTGGAAPRAVAAYDAEGSNAIKHSSNAMRPGTASSIGFGPREWYHRGPSHRRRACLCQRRPMMYPLFRPLLFTLDPETAHEVAFVGLDAAARLGIARVF